MLAASSDTPSPPLDTLLVMLLDRFAQPTSTEAIQRAVEDLDPSADWTDRLEDAAQRVGLRLRWMSSAPDEAASLARPDLPLVTVARDALGQPGSWVLDGKGPLRVRATCVDDPRGPSWLTAAQLRDRIGGGVRAWALVEPLLPASPMGTPPGATASPPLQRLLGLMRIERDDLGVVVVYAVAVGVLSLATPLAMQVLINWLAFGALLQPVIVLGAALLVFLALAAALRTLQRVAVETVQRRVFVRMAADVSERLARVDVTSFDRAYGPELVNRFFDVLTVQKAVRSLVLDGLAALLQAVVGLAVLALYHPVLLVFDVLLIAAVAVVWVPLGRGAARTALVESKRKYEVAGWVEEMARHPVLFKLGGARLGPDRADHRVRAYLEARAAHFGIFMRQYVGMQAVQVLVSATLLVLCGWLVLDGELTLGQLVAAEFIVTSALAGLAKFTDKLDTYYDLLAGVDKLGTLVDLPGDRVTGLTRAPGGSPARVALRDVAVRSPGRPGGLSGVSLELAPRSRTAIVGAPGTGKSALADLVVGVRNPGAGTVSRDGTDLRALHPDTVYRDVGLLRGVELVAGTVRDNLGLGRPGVDTEEMLRCLDRVGMADAVAQLSDGIDTRLSPTGAPLTEGQLRALMVARALAGRPRLLVVDGFFDGAGPHTRTDLLAPLIADDAPFTLLVFTEDPSLARELDRSYTLTDGGLHARARLSPV